MERYIIVVLKDKVEYDSISGNELFGTREDAEALVEELRKEDIENEWTCYTYQIVELFG